jgi:hypothetical protein
MTFDESLTTVTREKSTADFDYAMNEIRSWLDRRRIQPVGFKTIPRRKIGGVAIEIRFDTEDEAYLFLQKFSPNGRIPPGSALSRE